MDSGDFCCRGLFSEHFLTFSACYEFVPAFTDVYPIRPTLGLYIPGLKCSGRRKKIM